MTTEIDTWLEKGKGMLETLESRRGVLAGELRQVESDIARVRKSMGFAPEGTGSKVMVRSVIKQVLLAHGGDRLNEAQLIAAVQEIQPKASEASIRTSLARAARTDKWCRESPTGSFVYVTG